MKNTIQVKGLRKSYGQLHALQQTSEEIFATIIIIPIAFILLFLCLFGYTIQILVEEIFFTITEKKEEN